MEPSPDADDFFGPQTSSPSSREVEKLRRVHHASGFRDAATGAREAHLQAGFDAGFGDGARAAADAGFWMGAAAVLDAAAMEAGGELRRIRMALRAQIRGLDVDGEVSGVHEAAEAVRRVAPGIGRGGVGEVEGSGVRGSEGNAGRGRGAKAFEEDGNLEPRKGE